MIGFNTPSIRDQGERFKFFRRLVEKGRREMALDLKKTLSHVTAIEQGKISPDHSDLITLFAGFGMNSGWLITGKQGIFTYRGEKTPVHAYLMGTMLPYNGLEPEIRQFDRLFRGLRGPGLKKQILVELEEIIAKIQGIFNEAGEPG